MKYTTYEDSLIVEFDTDLIQCPKCEGLKGCWQIINDEEVWVDCSQCDGEGEGTEKGLGL